MKGLLWLMMFAVVIPLLVAARPPLPKVNYYPILKKHLDGGTLLSTRTPRTKRLEL